MKKYFLLSLLLLLGKCFGQTLTVQETINYINKIMQDNPQYGTWSGCRGNYYDYFFLADHGYLKIMRHISYNNCFDKSLSGKIDDGEYCHFHNSEISVSSVIINSDNHIVLKSKNGSKVFKFIGNRIDNSFEFTADIDNYDAQRCLKAIKHLVTALQSDPDYNRNNVDDPFAEKVSRPAQNQSNKSVSTVVNVFKSDIYGYKIEIPTGFNRTTATGKHIDLKLINNDGSSILINVTRRTAEEYGIDAHSYSKEMLESGFKQYSPSISISKAEKIYISGEKAFLINYTNPSNGTKAIEIYIYKGENAYVFTATTKTSLFPKYEAMFMKSFNSFRF